LINGLWYLSNIKPVDITKTEHTEAENIEAEHTEAENKMYGLAIEQWSAFDRFSLECMITLPTLPRLIDNR
jgi:hypothetical protein